MSGNIFLCPPGFKSPLNFPHKVYLCGVARVLAIDYGTKRTGIAVTDPLQLIASPLETVSTASLLDYLRDYLSNEEVETIVIGEPLHADGKPMRIHHLVVGLARKLQKNYPELAVELHDESFTSENAKKIILQSGTRKKKRRDKSLIDKVSAALILNDYLESKRIW
jgi:putative Holliday junction resolvase